MQSLMSPVITQLARPHQISCMQAVGILVVPQSQLRLDGFVERELDRDMGHAYERWQQATAQAHGHESAGMALAQYSWCKDAQGGVT